MQWISDLWRRRRQDEFGSIVVDVVVTDDDGSSGLKARTLSACGSLWQRTKQRHRFLNERPNVPMNALPGYGTCEACGGRPEHEVDVPFAPGDDDLAVDVVNPMPGGRMFRDPGTHSQQIDEYELAQDLSMNVGTWVVTGLAKVPDDLIGGGH